MPSHLSICNNASIRTIALACALLLSLTACAETKPYVILKGQNITVEVADSPSKQALGLMYRRELAEDQGMLFIYSRIETMSFWMKNTLIPLDIMFFDHDLRLINVSANTPPCKTARCPSYKSTAPGKYVLEVNAGLANKWGVQPGDKLELHLQ